MKWIPVEERTPENDTRVLLSFEGSKLSCEGKYVEDKDGNGKFLVWCDRWKPCVSMDLYVNAWIPMPKPYREDEE